MGVSITELIPSKEIRLDDLSGEIIAVDASLFIYQFLATIRQRDGKPLMDSGGRETSHLSGLFQRTLKMIEKGIKPVYVFDGTASEFKNKERQQRAKIKKQAEKKYEEAVQKGDVEEMKKYAMRTSRLTPEIIKESKELLNAMGVPVIQAESEGEAQAAYMVKKGEAYAVASSDADSLLFGADRVVKNLAITGRRKKTKALTYQTIRPEMLELDKVLNSLGIDNDQFICLCMLVGTDYNPGGIKGIGPRKALDAIKKYKNNYDLMFKELKWDENFNFEWTEIFYLIKKMPVADDYNIEFGEINKQEVIRILVEEHDFSRDRIESSLKKLVESQKEKQQKGLGEFF